MTNPSVVEVQHQIRANATQLQDYFSDLYAWENSIGKRKSVRQKGAKPTAAPRPRAVNVGRGGKRGETVVATTLNAHTLDKGYTRWASDDADTVLKAGDEEDDLHQVNDSVGTIQRLPRQVSTIKTAKASSPSREELEKEDGNTHYKQGRYVAAIKSYTRCLACNPHHVVVRSNRAMAYLKTQEFANAEDDCTLALKTDATHVKSYLRRATARNSLGKHRLALLDFQRAATLNGENRQVETQLQSTREFIRLAIKRSTKRTEFAIKVVNEHALTKPTSLKDGSEDNGEKKEMIDCQLPAASLDSTKPRLLQASSHPRYLTTRLETTQTSAYVTPKLPKKAPKTSYEFNRVWQTLTLRGDAEHQRCMLRLRAEYLRQLDPRTLRTVFQSGIESDVLGAIFHTLRHAVLCGVNEDTVPTETLMFALALANGLTNVPRFNMTILLWSSQEKEDCQWVITQLAALRKKDKAIKAQDVAKLYKLYALP